MRVFPFVVRVLLSCRFPWARRSGRGLIVARTTAAIGLPGVTGPPGFGPTVHRHLVQGDAGSVFSGAF